MSAQVIVRFDDGSALFRDPELRADPGTASVALASARRIAGLPAVEAAESIEVGRTEPALVARDAFRAVLAEAYAEQLEGETFWLFRRDPLACLPSLADRTFLETIEPRLRAFDEAVREGSLGDPRESARRRIILAELRAAGVLDEPLLDLKIEILDELGAPTVASMASAARMLARYFASPERARWVRMPPPASIHSSALSLDWARSITTSPPGFQLFEWWATLERTFLKHPTSAGARGVLYMAQGNLFTEIFWRSEGDEHSVLYDARISAR